MLDKIHAAYAKLMARPLISWQRYLLAEISQEDRLVGIIGARGVGKTTLMLQLIKQRKNHLIDCLYLSLDSLLASNIDLFSLAEEFEQQGGKLLVLDEVHHYQNFEQVLKMIYDQLSLQVIFSGSSALHLEHSKADLSRRAVMYRLAGLSFREFINLTEKLDLPAYSLQEICANHQEITQEIVQKVRPLALFQDYLNFGYYPFFIESRTTYSIKLAQTLALTIDLDLPKIFKIEPDKLASLKKLMVILCQAKPQELNISKLAAAIGVSRTSVYSYLNYLEQAELIRGVWGEGKNTGMMAKPEKLYLSNANGFYALCDSPDLGTLRETFFVSQLAYLHELRYPKKADFLVDNQFLFEIGGEGKTTRQLKDSAKPAYLALDGIEHGRGNKIPLWLFGFLY